MNINCNWKLLKNGWLIKKKRRNVRHEIKHPTREIATFKQTPGRYREIHLVEGQREDCGHSRYQKCAGFFKTNYIIWYLLWYIFFRLTLWAKHEKCIVKKVMEIFLKKEKRYSIIKSKNYASVISVFPCSTWNSALAVTVLVN